MKYSTILFYISVNLLRICKSFSATLIVPMIIVILVMDLISRLGPLGLSAIKANPPQNIRDNLLWIAGNGSAYIV